MNVMSKFIKIFVGNSPENVENQANEFSKQHGFPINSCSLSVSELTQTMNRTFYLSVVFSV